MKTRLLQLQHYNRQQQARMWRGESLLLLDMVGMLPQMTLFSSSLPLLLTLYVPQTRCGSPKDTDNLTRRQLDH